MDAYEKLNQFYLGKVYDPAAAAPTDDLLLYSARDLTTHGVCVGMTGSGKTGLCVSLLEEAAIDGIPVIAIDPKGDLGNLALNFPKLRGEDFAPWVDPAEASRKGMTVEDYATDRAELWRKGLASWDQRPDRIQRLRDAADVAIYTPGSATGLQLKVLRSLAAPPPEVLADADALRERTQAYVSALLALLGVDADPVKSREHILLSNLIDRAWRDGRDLDLARLIQEIQQPPFDRLGVFELDSFYPAKDRFELALALNNLLASPTFAAWIEGEPLDIQRLMFTPDGRNRISILSIAHLSDAERMFFVTLLLNEVVAWMRQQPGTGSLRAILYMDEVFGYLPPTANPPSKLPLLTMLKQARAFGLGVLLATQNPVDLDYKALSNAGTWFIGRLQTERDRARLLDGLQSTDSQFDRRELVDLIKALDSRVFLMNNVHDGGPVLMHTRWALSYLRGPLTRTQIQDLMAPRVAQQQQAIAAARPKPKRAARKRAPRPVLPPEIEQAFVPVGLSGPDGAELTYQPALVATAQLHYTRTSAGIDEYRGEGLYAPLSKRTIDDPWDAGIAFSPASLDLDDQADEQGSFAALPAEAASARQFKRWQKDLVDHLYRTRDGLVLRCKALKAYSRLNESEADFRASLRHKLHEERDLDLEKLRKRFEPKVARLEERIRKAEQRVEKERSQVKQAGFQTVLSMGSSLLGALFGGRRTKMSTAARQAGRTMQQRGDVTRAKETVEALREELAEMEADLQERLDEITDAATVDQLELEELRIRPKKSTLEVEKFTLAWLPHWVDTDGMAAPAFELE